jgi:Subtilase family
METMLQGSRLSHLLGRSLSIAAALALLVPATAAATLGTKQHGPLSPELRKLGAPSLSGKSDAQQAAALGLPPGGPGSLIREGHRLLVDIRFDAGATDHLDVLRSAGARIVAVSRGYQTVTAAVPPEALQQLAGVPNVGSVSAVPAPLVFASCEGGSVISEGVAQINAKAAREKFGLDGEGVTVGVLSDSFDAANGTATEAKDDVETEDLPGLTNECLNQKTPVDVRKDLKPSEEGEDEGRAMLQIVHDVAPAAKLAFATAFLGETAFAESIEELAEPVLSGGAGAKVIVDDVAYLEEPFFQDGPVAAAVNKVTSEGASYLSAAGNDNLIDSAGRDIASWEAPSFRDSGSCPSVVQALGAEFNPTHCMDFAPGSSTDDSFGITVEREETLVLGLQWAEPWFGVGTDLDAFLLNSGGTKILAEGVDNNISGTKKPSELLFWDNEASSSRTVQPVVNRYAGGNPRLKFIFFQNGGGVTGIEYPDSSGGDVVGPSVFGHAGAASAISVGAIAFNSTTKPERYSSRGPVTHYFGEVDGTTPAAPLGPQVIPKPDVTATDCGATTFFAFKEGATWRFCGTSAAAPHAAGALALLLQAGEEAGGGLEEPEPLRAALLQSAAPIGSFGPCAIGAGLVETEGAVEALLAGPGPLNPPDCEPPSSSPNEEPKPGEPNPGESTPPPPAPPGSTTPLPTPTVPGRSAPRTSISKHPRKLVRTHSRTARTVFRFGSDQAGATFRCKFDAGTFRGCGSRIAHRFGLGPHVVKAVAVSSAGLADTTPAVFRFRVRHVS